MFGRASHHKLSGRQRFRLEVASAVARERIFEVHAAHARELVRILNGRLLPLDALRRYARHQRLTRQESALLRSRVLSRLSEVAVAPAEQLPEPDVEGQVPVEEVLELAGGRAHTAILDCHVRNALDFIELFDGVLTQRQASIVYAETVGLLRPWDEVVYSLSLDRRSESRLPAPGAGFPGAARAAGSPPNRRSRRRARTKPATKPVAARAAQQRA